MIKEALQYLVSLSPMQQVKGLDGKLYTDKAVFPVAEEQPASLAVATLTGFVGAIDHNIAQYPPEDVLVVVRSASLVSLVRAALDERGRRQTYLQAHCEPFLSKFPFGRFMSSEEFIIGLLANFVATDDLPELLKVCSNLSAEQVTISEDDGVSQKATIKTGIVLKGTAKVRPRVQLAPFRTFPEVAQPASDFLFRLRNDKEGAPPFCALFEADGRRWEQAAMLDIQKWLVEHVKLPVIA